jgi:hypothetical protein
LALKDFAEYQKTPRFQYPGFGVADSAVPHAKRRPSSKFVEPPVNLFKPLSKPEQGVLAVLVKG